MLHILARASAAIVLSLTVAVSSTSTQTPPTEYPTPSPEVLETQDVASPSPQPPTENELRITALQNFLTQQNSPLADNAADFVDTANIHGLDWKLLPAIAGVESSFGKHVPQNSYNPFGWANGDKRFSSWQESIQTVGEGIERIYHSKGRITPQQMQPIYAPPSTTWANKVNHFMTKIDNQYQKDSQLAPNSQSE